MTKKFAFGSTKLPWADYVSDSAVFKGLKAENLNYDKIYLLVDNHLEELFWPLKGKKNPLVNKNGVRAVNTKLGWMFALDVCWATQSRRLPTKV